MKKLLASAVLGAGALALINAPSAQAGPTFYFGDGKKLTVFQMVQIWSIYGLKYDIPGETNLKDKKANIYIRRGRFGFKGSIRKDLGFKVWFAYDNLGRDDLNPNDGARGAVKTSGLNYSKMEVWDAQFTWKANPEWANITIGYFRPQVGKESITSGFGVLTLEKGLPNFYVRRHIIGKPDTKTTGAFSSGNGRVFNVTLGGLHKDSGWSLNYNFAFADDQNYTDKSNWSPLLTARVAVSIGDPEMKKYKLGYKQTYFGKRNGVTIGLNYAHQGNGIDRDKNKKFDKNELYGVDLLANYGPVDIAAEYDIMKRNWNDGTNYKDTVWEVRAGYLIPIGKQFIQPVVSYEKFKPDSNGNSIKGKKENTRYDIGINWYVNKQKLKINLHYAYGEVKNYKNKNNNKTGTVKAGYLGLGLQFKF
ncbi:MAG: porin [Aquificota bacterium]|nr:MAG: porin [Aquificota bacterium]